ncbi:MAG TPA: hypothetical protein VGS17_09395 [Candidatus Limnocylindria bacterium]|nr:hypothetical protein [Candidatus Limnocylindria bacterium]
MRRLSGWAGLTVASFLVVGTFLHFPGSLDDVGLEPAPLIFGGLTGLLIGAAQLPALRGVLRSRWQWLVATAAGIAVTHAMGDGLSPSSGYLPVALAGGLATGVFQAAVLRRPWWALVTAAAFVIGIVGGWSIAIAGRIGSIFEEDWVAQHAIMSSLTGVLYALFTAPLFARFPRNNGLPILGSDGAA